MYTENELIEKCLKGNKEAQKALYDKYAGKMFALCMRYTRHKLEAEDVMQEGFIRVFENLDTFRGEGSLGSWIRTIMVHTAIKNYNRSSYQKESIGLDNYPEESMIPKAYADLNKEEILNLINDLPEGYRIVFNMYAIEGYKHKEIAQMLNIGESTSRSQLVKARKLLQSMIEKLYTVIL